MCQSNAWTIIARTDLNHVHQVGMRLWKAEHAENEGRGEKVVEDEIKAFYLFRTRSRWWFHWHQRPMPLWGHLMADEHWFFIYIEKVCFGITCYFDDWLKDYEWMIASLLTHSPLSLKLWALQESGSNLRLSGFHFWDQGYFKFSFALIFIWKLFWPAKIRTCRSK